jgi:hypothetical protein
MNQGRAKYVWDYDLTQEQFDQMLAGEYENGNLNRDWAAVRVIEWAQYGDMVRLIGFPALVREWPRWRKRLRSEQQRQSLDWLVAWLPKYHPELLVERSTHGIQ